MRPQAAILAIGSELLSGQTLNRNASWLSAKLFAVGLDTQQHTTVDDREGDIVDALKALATKAQIIFVTGGLGPTSDDLTRNAVAAFAGEPLVYHEASWTHLSQRFATFSRSVPEANRQQCFFPSSARVLTNPAGTANAFTLQVGPVEVWVLPGPPREVEAVWDLHIKSALEARVPAAQRQTLRMWRTVGKGESHLAELVEPLLAEHGLDIAYRVHAPYVELKIRFPSGDAARHQQVLSQLDQALSPWLYERDEDNVADALATWLLAHGPFVIIDHGTAGNLAEMLWPALRSASGPGNMLGGINGSLISGMAASANLDSEVREDLASMADAACVFSLRCSTANGMWALGVRGRTQCYVQSFPLPYTGEVMAARNRNAVAAIAMRQALTWLHA